MDIKTWFLHKILRKNYIRTGSCKACGKCCKEIYVRHGKKTIKNEEEYLKLKHFHSFYSYLKPIDKDEIGLIFECTNLDPETKKCKIHPFRPPLCRKYPQEEVFMMGGSISADCGYKFTPIRTFDSVFKEVAKKFTRKF